MPIFGCLLRHPCSELTRCVSDSSREMVAERHPSCAPHGWRPIPGGRWPV